VVQKGGSGPRVGVSNGLSAMLPFAAHEHHPLSSTHWINHQHRAILMPSSNLEPSGVVARRVVFSSTGDLTRDRSQHGAALFRRRGTLVANVVRGALDSVVTLLFPSDCRLCGLPLASSCHLPVCPECLDSIEPIAGERCLLCGERLFSVLGQKLCGECLTERPPFVKASAYGSYDAGLRELIHLLKYEGVKPAGDVLGRMLAEAVTDLVPDFEDEPPLVVPVPLHATKQRERGFNQAELIARGMTKQKPLGVHLHLAPELLIRKRETKSQVGYTRQQRIGNLRGAFAAPVAIGGRDILLVDDVFTTGTTVSECTRVLRRAGAGKVWVATVARVLKAEVTFARIEMEEGEQPQASAMAARA
jgi:ComF family protein